MIINHSDVIDDIKKYSNNFFNTIFSDPPYCLGSKIYIDKKDGKMKFENCQDFMSKWQLSHEHWEQFFQEAFRVLKFGGFCVVFGMDRQISLVKYYAIMAGFEECQSLYWYYISGFPKGFNISKGIDDRLGEEREVVGRVEPFGREGRSYNNSGKPFDFSERKEDNRISLTKPSSDLAKQYDGYKSGIAPLKPCLETILVFKKPLNKKSTLDNVIEISKNNSPDVFNIDESRIPSDDNTQRNTKMGSKYSLDGKNKNFQYADGEKITGGNPSGRYPSQLFVDSETAKLLDDSSPDVFNIDGSRVPITDSNLFEKESKNPANDYNDKPYRKYGKYKDNIALPLNRNGRYPSQLFVDNETAELLDSQSGELHSGDNCVRTKPSDGYHGNIGKSGDVQITYGDSGGASRILHKCDYEDVEKELVFYCPKVSQFERNAGCEVLEDRILARGSGTQIAEKKDKEYKQEGDGGFNKVFKIKNNHPTIKPISLITKLAILFKLPKEIEQKVYIPFCGVFSEIIGFLKAGYDEEKMFACEINKDYISIGKARLKHWKGHSFKIKNMSRKKKSTEILKLW